MDQTEAIDLAKEAIGRGQPDDYILEPTRHAEQLDNKAPALVRLLGKSEIENLAAQYERLDHEAGAAQKKFKDTMTWANAAVLAAERTRLEHRVQLLRPDSLDPDLLEERARDMLNYGSDDELLILLPDPLAD